VSGSATPFHAPGRLRDGDLELVLTATQPGDAKRGLVPQYEFEMRLVGSGTKVGHLHFRIGLTGELKRFGGNLGYDVEAAYRGHRYAARACRLIFPLARQHGLRELWVTCAPENTPSRRTCEIIGAKHLDTVSAEASPGQPRPTCRYVIDLTTA